MIKLSELELEKIAFPKPAAQADFEAWKQWHKEPEGQRKKELLNASLDRFNPAIQRNLSMWGNAPQVNKDALRLDLLDATVHAHKTWDPRKAELNTWVNTNHKKVLRKIELHSNLAYTPSDRSRLIGPYQRAHNQLQERLGESPTDSQMADFMGQPEKIVRKLRMDTSRKDISGSAFAEDPIELMAHQHSPLPLDVLSLMDQQPDKPENDVFFKPPTFRPQSPAERRAYDRELAQSQRTREVYNSLRGIKMVQKPDGTFEVSKLKRLPSKGAVAKKLGVSPSTVSRAVGRIQGVIKEQT